MRGVRVGACGVAAAASSCTELAGRAAGTAVRHVLPMTPPPPYRTHMTAPPRTDTLTHCLTHTASPATHRVGMNEVTMEAMRERIIGAVSPYVEIEAPELVEVGTLWCGVRG